MSGMLLFAWCFRDGVIHLSAQPAQGALVISSCRQGDNAEAWWAEISVLARHGYDRLTRIVPGVPEAEDDDAAFAAVSRFRDWLAQRAAKRASKRS